MPVHSLEAAKAWRDEHCDPDRVKRPPGAAAAAPADGEMADLKRRLLAAEVGLAESRLDSYGGAMLPSVKVEKAFLFGLQYLRCGVDGMLSPVYMDVATAIGEPAARTMFGVLGDWWRGVYNVACDGIMLGLQEQFPQWGADFRARWITTHRGNFPDVPMPGEPRALEDVKRAAEAASEADGDA